MKTFKLFLSKFWVSLVSLSLIAALSKLFAFGRPINHWDVFVAIGFVLSADIAVAILIQRPVYRAAIQRIEQDIVSAEHAFKQDLAVAKKKWQAEEAALLDLHVSTILKK